MPLAISFIQGILLFNGIAEFAFGLFTAMKPHIPLLAVVFAKTHDTPAALFWSIAITALGLGALHAFITSRYQPSLLGKVLTVRSPLFMLISYHIGSIYFLLRTSTINITPPLHVSIDTRDIIKPITDLFSLVLPSSSPYLPIINASTGDVVYVGISFHGTLGLLTLLALLLSYHPSTTTPNKLVASARKVAADAVIAAVQQAQKQEQESIQQQQHGKPSSVVATPFVDNDDMVASSSSSSSVSERKQRAPRRSSRGRSTVDAALQEEQLEIEPRRTRSSSTRTK